jgi:hypothetical protein
MLVKVHDARLDKILAGQGLPTQDYAEIEVNLTAAIPDTATPEPKRLER